MQIVMDAAKMREAIKSLAARVMDDPAVAEAGPKGVALVGIRNRGDIVAERIAAEIEKSRGVKVPVGALDITMYRDDLSGRRAITIPRGTDMNFRVDDLVVILVDDVLETGRSVRAALDALVDFGRPRIIRAAALVDRGGREYPIAADYVGVTLDRAENERVVVRVTPEDPEDVVFVEIRSGGGVKG